MSFEYALNAEMEMALGMIRETVADNFKLMKRNAKLREENAKLRESVRNLLTCIKHEECEESCPNYSPLYSSRGYERHSSIVVVDDYVGCCLVGLENCNSTLFDTDEYLCELGIEASDDNL